MASDPRIAVKELIVTRHKSAQLKRQLRSGDRSMKKITQLLKSPERSKHLTVNRTNSPVYKTYKNTLVKQKTSPQSPKVLAARQVSLLKSPRKRKVSEKFDCKEFHPNKVKRKMNRKTVTLKPKHELTKVLSLNKRKLTTPRKGTNSPIHSPSNPLTAPTLAVAPSAEIGPAESTPRTVEELVNAYDDDSLTNEDLIEICTCPSPVWWEEPPDWRYREDPIPSNLLHKRAWQEKEPPPKLIEPSPAVVNTSNSMPAVTTVKVTTQTNPMILQTIETMAEAAPQVDINIELTKKDVTFIKKRSALENLLSGIKNKSPGNKAQGNKCTNNYIKTSNANTRLDSIDQVLKDNSGLLQKSLLKHRPSILKETKHNEELSDIVMDSNTQESSNEDILTDMCQDDILNDLENLEIPIETTKDDAKEKPPLNAREQSMISDDDTASNFSDKSQVSPEDDMKRILVEGSDQFSFSDKYKVLVPPLTSTGKAAVWSQKEEKSSELVKTLDDSKDIPENMPPLRKYSKLTEIKMASPGNAKFESGESDFDSSSVISGQDVDTISDTNVKYLNDDQISDYEGDRSKPRTETGTGEGSNSENNRKETEDTIDASKETEVPPNTENVETNIGVADVVITKNHSPQQLTDATVPDDPDCRKDCIIVYKIIETVSESNEDSTTESANLNTKPKRTIKPTTKKSPDQNSTSNNINDFFKNCKNLATTGKRSKSKVQRVKKAANSRTKAFAKKVCEADTTNRLGDDKKSIAVTDSKTVKYCLKCSSIFDTQACTYCVLKT